VVDPDTLSRLRGIVQSVRDKDGGPVPFEELLALGTEDRLRAGITIDFQASETIGAPVVVLHNPADGGGLRDLLSPRELEVAGMIAEGLGNKQIAHRLEITVGTVKDHVHHILQKADLPNRAAIAVAYRQIR